MDFTGNIATAWAKLIRKDVLDSNGIEHNESLRQGSEGIEFNIRLFEHIDSAVFTNKVYYHYIYNPNSISAKHDEKNHFYVVKCFEAIENRIREQGNQRLLTRLYTRFLYVIISSAITGYFSPNNKQSYSEKKRSYQKYIEMPFVKESLLKGNRGELDSKRKLILKMIELKQYWLISILAKVRHNQKK